MANRGTFDQVCAERISGCRLGLELCFCLYSGADVAKIQTACALPVSRYFEAVEMVMSTPRFLYQPPEALALISKTNSVFCVHQKAGGTKLSF